MSDQAYFTKPGASGSLAPRPPTEPFNVVVHFAEAEPFLISYGQEVRAIFGPASDLIFVATSDEKGDELRAFEVTGRGTLKEVTSVEIIWDFGDEGDLIDAVSRLVSDLRLREELPVIEVPNPISFKSL